MPAMIGGSALLASPGHPKVLTNPRPIQYAREGGTTILFGKCLACVVFVSLTVTAAAALIGPQSPYGGSGNPVPTSSELPGTTGFDAPVTPVVGTRPLLVVLMEFSDLPADVPADFIENQIFGPRPSMNDFYLETTYGQFGFADYGHFAWVTAWDDPSTTDDESTRSYWDTSGIATHGDGGFQSWGLRSLDAAGFDFAPLDINGDGSIAFGTEVAYLVIDSKPAGSRGGASRCMPSLTLDGKTTEPGGTLGCPFGVSAGVSEDSPWIAIYAHELGHEALDFPDYYAITPQNIGYFSLMGYSGYGAWEGPIGPHHYDPYLKMKRGWYSPTVIVSDGFYDVPDAETNPAAFILHDPAHGTDEYFIVENRWKGTSYENSDELIVPMDPPLPPADAAADIPDEGLLVWHVDETRDWNGVATGGYSKVALERRGGTDDTAAWNSDDPGYYDFNDASAPMNSIWNGGVDSKTGVWCVSPAGATMRAWLDVPGPGILVCPVTMSASAVPGSSGTLTVRLTNTGDASDTFSVSVGGLGADLTVAPIPTVTLAARASVTVNIQITPVRACTNTPGLRPLTITSQSTSDPSVLTTIDGATVEVLPFREPHTAFALDSVAVDSGETATFSLGILNGGNVDDTFSLSFDAVDFGTAYRAFPTEIQPSWVSMSPTDPTAPPCGVALVTLDITVPLDWAGIEDATYDFTITATSSAPPDSDTAAGHLTVHATALSMMLFVKAEIASLLADVDALPPSDVRDGLHAKATAAYNKVTQAIDRYIAGDDPPASNLFKTTQNILKAFLHLVDAQRGKTLTPIQADDLTAKTQRIIDDIDTILLAI